MKYTQHTLSTTPPAAPSCPTAIVRWKGRDYRIFKKQPHAGATYYYEFYQGSDRERVNLQTPDRSTAETTLKLFLEGQSRGLVAQMRALLAGHAIVTTQDQPAIGGDIQVEKYLNLFENTPTGNNHPESRAQYVTRFQRLCAVAKTEPGTLKDLLPAFQAFRVEYNRLVEQERSQARQQSMKRTHNSMLTLASSCFTPAAAAALAEHLPSIDFGPLRDGIKNLYFKSAGKTVAQYCAPPQAVLDATIESWMKLPRNEFISVGTALSGGLRRGEIKSGNRSWIRDHDGYIVFDASGNFKSQTGELYTRALDPFYSLMMDRCRREGWLLDVDEPFVTPSKFDISVSAWMKSLGWRTKKHLHALRAWAGSLVYTRYGAGPAKKFCRHSDEKTTRQHYAWLRDDWAETGTVILVAGKPVQWAKVVN